MPTYNNGAYLDTAVNSVLKQTIRDFELIIVDNFSTDDTSKIVKILRIKELNILNLTIRELLQPQEILEF